MSLTPEQKGDLKDDALQQPSLATAIALEDWPAVTNFYNANAAPNFFVWRTSVNVADLMSGPGFDWTRVDNLTVGKARIWEFMTAAVVVKPNQVAVRNGFEACFSVEAGDQPCRQAIYDASQRLASNVEKLFATGAGTASTHHGVGPATMAFEGPVSLFDVQSAMTS